MDNVGDKTFGSPTGYATCANQPIYNATIPGGSAAGRVFVGQRKAHFFIAVKVPESAGSSDEAYAPLTIRDSFAVPADDDGKPPPLIPMCDQTYRKHRLP